ncbi:MAG: PBP1A family penicillin-binding protein [Patescibacteria group bacterium]|nr:PBP1A family penicillin-binding protein [Patescibacteria group bacterium]
MLIHRISKSPSGTGGIRQRLGKINKNKVKAIAVVAFLALVGLGLVGILSLTIVMAWISRDLPDPNTLLTREVPQSTKIYDRSGETLLYEIHGDQKRTLVALQDIPDYMKEATVSIEDRAFYEHHGIYWRGLVRAFTVGLLQNKRVEGTSTLTQQLVKNAILTNERTITRKIKELLLSFQLERQFTKDQILQMYLNEVPYGAMIYGVGSASESYFGKEAKDLTLDEAALLAAIPQAPDRLSPYGIGVNGDNRPSLIARQHLILDDMVRDEYITREQADEAKQIDTLKKLIPYSVGDINAPHFVMYVKSQLVDAYGQKQVEQGGLRVITTLDWGKQQIAQEEIEKGVDKNGARYKFSNAALVAIDPKNGQILSMVGSKDFFDDSIDGQVNVTLRPRQPGSSFKPIVYTAGFIKGYTPDTTLWDVPTTFVTDSGPYNPKNYSSTYNGPLTVRKALQGSLNIPAVKMLYLVGIGRVLDFADQLGYTTLGDRSRYGLSLVLGGGDVKLLEHANAYAAFANRGTQYPVSSILKVTDANGQMLEEWKQSEGSQVVPQDAADEISNVLSDNEARAYVFGAGNYLTLSGRQVAAKTGTTNNNKDAWTMGYTPSLVAGVWVGNSSSTEMSASADGSVVAAPIWQGFMKRALTDAPKENFSPMPSITANKPVLLGQSAEKTVKVDRLTGKLASEFTPIDLVEDRKFYEAHNILWYLDKDDPLGPVPSNPANDPQFANWEKGVQDWVVKNQWHTTSTDAVPTEYDDVHTQEDAPVVSINTPSSNATLYSREGKASVSVQAQRTIQRLEVKMDDVLIGSAFTAQSEISYQIPNSVVRGYHDLSVYATDDVGNRGVSKITVNLMADPAPLKIAVNFPLNNSILKRSNFPLSISLLMNDVENVAKIDVFVKQNASVQLVGSVTDPKSSTNQIDWIAAPPAGEVQLYPVAYFSDDSTLKGDEVRVNIE